MSTQAVIFFKTCNDLGTLESTAQHSSTVNVPLQTGLSVLGNGNRAAKSLSEKHMCKPKWLLAWTQAAGVSMIQPKGMFGTKSPLITPLSLAAVIG